MIDAHCHLGPDGSRAEAVDRLHREAVSSGVDGVVLLNLPGGETSNRELLSLCEGRGGFFRVFAGLHPFDEGVLEELERLKGEGATGLKLHPRLGGYRFDDPATVALVRRAGELNLPVMIDCFPDGENLILGNTVERFARLAREAPGTRVAMGHAGGHHIMDAMMAAKRLDNLYLDLSFTLLYYRENPRCVTDMAHASRNARGKVFWGTDHPDRPYAETVSMSRAVLDSLDVSVERVTDILETAPLRFLGEEGG